MASQDYNSLTVVQIKELLKERQIPAKGLTRKQQFIDRLLEHDAARDANTDTTSQIDQHAPTDESAHKIEDGQDSAQQPQASAEDVAVEEQRETADEPVAEGQASQPEPQPQSKEDPATTSAEAAQPFTGAAASVVPEESQETPPEPPNEAPTITEELQLAADNSFNESVSVSPKATSKDESLAADESKKRKRRSATPPIDSEEIAKKRARQDEEGIAPQVLLKEDDKRPDPPEVDMKDSVGEEKPDSRHVANADAFKTETDDPSQAAEQPQQPAEGAHINAEPTPKPDKEAIPAASPPLHLPTSALYIRNLKRPIRAEALERHLKSLGSLPNDLPLATFYINRTKSHAFAAFSASPDAERVRAKLHGTVWPDEPQREELWVDFVPPEEIERWIATEESSSIATRWEVAYEGEAENARVRHRVAAAQPAPPRGPSGLDRAPPIERGREQERASERPTRPAEKPTASFLKLDELFKSTTTKPKLYYLPVSRTISSRRLDELDRITASSIEGGSGLHDSRRFTFDDSMLVDDGPEFGLRGPPGARGGRGRAGGGPGGYRPPREGMRAWR